MTIVEIVKIISDLGMIGLLLVSTRILWIKIGKLETKLAQKQVDHLADIKAHGDIYIGLLERTNYSSQETNKLLEKGLMKVREEIAKNKSKHE